jgi:hypothetical protein
MTYASNLLFRASSSLSLRENAATSPQRSQNPTFLATQLAMTSHVVCINSVNKVGASSSLPRRLINSLHWVLF